jgi:hypothetical protein
MLICQSNEHQIDVSGNDEWLNEIDDNEVNKIRSHYNADMYLGVGLN